MKKGKTPNSLKEFSSIIGIGREGFILPIIPKQTIYQYIFEKALTSGRSEIDIIKELFSIDIDRFHSAYRKWKERYKTKQKNNKLKATRGNRRHCE